MSAKDSKIEVDVDDETLYSGQNPECDADDRLEAVEVTQFERGYN